MKFVVASKKVVAGVLVVTALLVAALFAVGMTDSESVYLGKSPRRLPIYSVETQEKKVALSFDAAWGADKTLGLLETLERYDARATFFAVGMWAEKYRTELKALADSGRMEIGTHSNTHPDMAAMSAYDINLELSTSVSLIESVTGGKVELFRPPFGSYSDTLIETAEDNGLYTIQWDVDTLDWKGLSASEIAGRVLNGVGCGSIVLMHNNGEHTLEALPLILEGLKNKGYSCVTIGELIYRDNFTIDHTGRQIRSN